MGEVWREGGLDSAGERSVGPGAGYIPVLFERCGLFQNLDLQLSWQGPKAQNSKIFQNINLWDLLASERSAHCQILQTESLEGALKLNGSNSGASRQEGADLGIS